MDPMPWKYAGKAFLALGQFEEALQCLTKAHQIDTKDPDTIKDIGNSNLKLGSINKATEWYEKSLMIDNDYAPAINNLANLKRQSGDNREAVALFKRAINADPKLVQAYVGTAACLLALGDNYQAEVFAIQAIEVNQNAPGVNEIRGIIYQNKQNLQQAIESYQKELAINPKSRTSLLNLGLLLLQQGKPAAAIEPLVIAGSISTSEQCSLLLAQAYQGIGQLKEAISEYKKINMSEAVNKMIPFNLGLCLLNNGNNIDAIEAFQVALKLDNNFIPALASSCTALVNEGRYEEALKMTQKNIELNPNDPNTFVNLGNIYKNLGNLDQALVSTLKALKLQPDNHTAHMNLGNIYTDLGNLDQALASTLKALNLQPNDPDAHMNLGNIYNHLGDLNQALSSTLKSLELKPNNPDAHLNLGNIYKHLGDFDQALSSTLKSLELKANNPDAHINLASIYQKLGKLDKALNSTLKSLELKPEASQALYLLGAIKIAEGSLEEAKKYLLKSIKNNPQEHGAYYELSRILKTAEEARELVRFITSTKISEATPLQKSVIAFAISNCLHRAGNYDEASKHLQIANKNKLIASPSNVKLVMQSIKNSLSSFNPIESTNSNTNTGKDRIFIVGMPRSGSTLLETILSLNPAIKDLEESISLEKAITKATQQNPHNVNYQNINELYSQFEPIDSTQHIYTTDKQLYNFYYINHIATHMPGAKIIHCQRNPMDNILSMYRSNLSAGNNYTASLEDSAKVLIAQEEAMQIQKNRYSEKIFTFDYDQFVNAPEARLRELLEWLELEFDERYLHPEKSTRSINTASSTQARKPINNKSEGAWKNYRDLLNPALKILKESGIKES